VQIHGSGHGIRPLQPSGAPARKRTPDRFHSVEAVASRQREVRLSRSRARLWAHSKKNAPKGVRAVALVDLRGIEPLTSSMPRKLPRAGGFPLFRPRSSGTRRLESRAGIPGCTCSVGHFLSARQFPDNPVLCDAGRMTIEAGLRAAHRSSWRLGSGRRALGRIRCSLVASPTPSVVLTANGPTAGAQWSTSRCMLS
jgi:hypothetical protein